MITYQTEKMIPCIGEIQTLIHGHWEEIAGHKDKIDLDPDWEKYRVMEEAGMVAMATVRDDGRMVGYSIFFVVPLMHYKKHRAASNDVVYLHPDYRKGFVGIRLLKYSHEMIKKLGGVHRIIWHLKPKSDWSAILERMGYFREEILMGAYIGD